MSFVTYAASKTQLLADLDLTNEVFFTAPELLGLYNEAIRSAERIIHGVNEDYFLTKEYLAIVSGTSEYDMPSGIFADRIRKVIYANGNTIYEIKRLRFKDAMLEAAYIRQLGAQHYCYMVENSLASGRKIILYPAALETASQYVQIWHIRNARTITQDSDTIDIPEFRSYIEQFVKVRLYEKEGHPNLSFAVQVLQRMEEDMKATLANRFADEDTVLEMDLSAYQEHT